MARIFITGSADGLGRDAARRLLADGHTVVGHARNSGRARSLTEQLPGVDTVLVADLASLTQVRELAGQLDAIGRCDAIIHNAGIGFREESRNPTEDGHARILGVNVLAPYVLTALATLPGRVIFLSSGMHHGGSTDLSDIDWTTRRWNGREAYAESKLYDTVLAAAIARRFPEVVATAVSPGWVATKMGGAGASDDLEAGSVTQAWLAVSEDPDALRSGSFYYHQQPADAHPAVHDVAFQDALLDALAQLTGVALPAGR